MNPRKKERKIKAGRTRRSPLSSTSVAIGEVTLGKQKNPQIIILPISSGFILCPRLARTYLVQIFIIYILIKNLNMTNPALERNHSYKGLGVRG